MSDEAKKTGQLAAVARAKTSQTMVHAARGEWAQAVASRTSAETAYVGAITLLLYWSANNNLNR